MFILNNYHPFYYSLVVLCVIPANKRETSEMQQLRWIGFSIGFSQVAHSLSMLFLSNLTKREVFKYFSQQNNLE